MDACRAFLDVAQTLEPDFYDFRDSNLNLDGTLAGPVLQNAKPVRYKALSGIQAFFELCHPSVVQDEEYSLSEAFNWACVCTAFRILTGVAPFSSRSLFETYQWIVKRSLSPAASVTLRQLPPGIQATFLGVLGVKEAECGQGADICRLECTEGLVSPKRLSFLLEAALNTPVVSGPERASVLEMALQEKTKRLEEALLEIAELKRRLALYEGEE